MLYNTAARPAQDVETRQVITPDLHIVERPASGEEASKAELRRQMYARIARGNALAEAEVDARRTWQGR